MVVKIDLPNKFDTIVGSIYGPPNNDYNYKQSMQKMLNR